MFVSAKGASTQIRLMDGDKDALKSSVIDANTVGIGRVEVLYADQWGTICDDNFEDADALVLCSSLGFAFG